MWVPLIILALSALSAWRMKNQIWCTFRRADRTKIEKFASVKQGRIDFDGGWYYLRPERTTLILWTKGIHLLVPTFVRSLDFRHNSSLPLDPNTFTNNWDTPETRKNLNKEEDIKALMNANRSSLGVKQKQGMLERFFPIIVICGFLVVGYMLWSMQQKQDAIGFALNTLQKMIMDMGQ